VLHAARDHEFGADCGAVAIAFHVSLRWWRFVRFFLSFFLLFYLFFFLTWREWRKGWLNWGYYQELIRPGAHCLNACMTINDGLRNELFGLLAMLGGFDKRGPFEEAQRGVFWEPDIISKKRI